MHVQKSKNLCMVRPVGVSSLPSATAPEGVVAGVFSCETIFQYLAGLVVKLVFSFVKRP